MMSPRIFSSPVKECVCRKGGGGWFLIFQNHQLKPKPTLLTFFLFRRNILPLVSVIFAGRRPLHVVNAPDAKGFENLRGLILRIVDEK